MAQFVTETVEEKIPVWVFCPSGPVREALEAILMAADFSIQEPGGEKPYAILIVGNAPIKLPRLPLGVPVYQLDFAVGTPARDPDAIRIVYEQVFADTPQPLSPLDELTRRLIFNDKILVRGGDCAPLLLEDAFAHTAQLMLSGKSSGGIFSGENLIPYTELIAGLKLKLKLKTGREVKQVRVPLLAKDKLPTRAMSEVLEEIAKFYGTLAEQPGMPRAVENARKLHRKRRRRAFLFSASFMSGLIISGGVLWYQSAARTLSSQVNQLAFAPNPQVVTSARSAVSQLEVLSRISDLLTGWIRQGHESDLGASLPLVSALLDGTQSVSEAKVSLTQGFQAFAGGGKADSLASLKTADDKLASAYDQFSTVQTKFLQQEISLPEVLGGQAVQGQLLSGLPEMRKKILMMRSSLSAVNSLLSGKHTLAFLLLDNTNLRGSGGVVTSVAVVAVDTGKLLTYQVYPVSVVNQMLTGEVQAPDEVKAYMREASWSLTDATWERPFDRSAQRILWFLGKELGRQVDAVVTIPANMLPQMLTAVGGVKLDGGLLTGDNFVSQRNETIAQLPQKTSALEDWENKIFSGVFDVVMKADDNMISKIAGVMLTGLNNSEIEAAAVDAEAKRVFSALSWDGTDAPPSCPNAFVTSTCRVSSVLEVENNVGGNNVNAFITRSHVHTIRVGQDVILHNRILTLTNKSPELTWPYGSYQVLVKFYLDGDASLQTISINDQVLAPGQFSLSKVDGRVQVRAGVEVAPSSTVRVRVLYTEPGIPTDNSSIVFFEQKQPGAGEDPFTLILTYPDQYTPKSVAPRAEVGRSSLTFADKHDANRLFAVGF